MKIKFLLCLLIICEFWSFSANAQGGTLPLNGSVTGNLAPSSTDSWQVTTNGDGLLRLTFHAVSPADLYVSLYDNNGTTLLGGPVESFNNSTVILPVDGLAAGTYVVKITPFSTSSGGYTLADSLFTPKLANDVEPNGSRATALTLALNDSATGHIGYYYNNQRDTSDWYKVTTTGDGLLRITLSTQRSSVYSTNGLDQNIFLYDKDGVTLLGQVEVFNSGNPAVNSLSVDGLAAGTYYIKVQSYHPESEFAAYTLSDSLFTPKLANDIEPNGSTATALTLPLNDSTTGHIGYYYNHLRDSSDWYKVTTTSDGLLRVTLSTQRSSVYSTNELDQLVFLYDNDGVTPLGQVEVFNGGGPAVNSLSVDGLAAGTYYIKVQSYHPESEFAAYTLSDSLFTYNANDIEPNDSAYEARTILSNRTTTGHISFYKNGGTRDKSDWFKINYTGTSGNLQFTFNLLPHISNPAQIGDVYFQVYKDTTASPIFNQEYYTTPNNTINLTSLTQGYYYIHIIPYSLNPVYFAAYSITNSFTQVNIAAISLLKSASYSCSTDSLIYALNASHSPYTVRIYRNGIIYDSLTTPTDSASFIGIKGGDYTATVFGDGATDNAFGQSTSVALLPPVPTGLNATNITSNSATLNWSMFPCIDFDTVEYRASDTATWKILTTPDNSGIYDLSNLAGNVTYLFRVASVVSGNSQNLSSAYSSTFSFKTLTALPVTLVNFSAAAHNAIVTLNWSTATEINNKGFEIFRSADGTNFSSIGFVAGAGNSDLLLNYQFTDKTGISGTVFYRLKQIDIDGKSVWSNIVSVTLNSNELITFMPNPANSFITISSPVIVKEVRLLGMNGQTIKVWQNVSPNAQLDLGSIASGTYLIQFLNDQSSQTMKLEKAN